MNIENKRWVLKKRPVGHVKDSDFELVTEMLPETVSYTHLTLPTKA